MAGFPSRLLNTIEGPLRRSGLGHRGIESRISGEKRLGVANGVVETLARSNHTAHSFTALRLFRSLGTVVLAARYVYSLAFVGFTLAGKSV